MTVFPVTNSTLSSEHIAAFVKEKYRLKGLVTASILKTGISHTYLVAADGEKYIFRVYSLGWRTGKEILEEIRLLRLLKDHAIPVSYAIADVQSNYLQELQAPEGLRYAVLFSFAKGEKRLNYSAELHYQAGEIMAGIHQITQNLRLERVDYTPGVLLDDSFEKLQQFLSPATDEMQFMKKLQQYLHQTFSTANEDNLRKGIVHLDIWFDNMVIDQQSAITLFDFDFCGNGWFFLDIGYYILQVFSTEKEGNEFAIKKDAFLKGYESVTPISAEEKELVPAAGAAIYFFYLGVQCSRFDNWSNVFLNEIYLKRFINLLVKKWADVHQLNYDLVKL
jgi:Ser/Thr protein kinase RdoA (MazF antagonist)